MLQNVAIRPEIRRCPLGMPKESPTRLTSGAGRGLDSFTLRAIPIIPEFPPVPVGHARGSDGALPSKGTAYARCVSLKAIPEIPEIPPISRAASSAWRLQNVAIRPEIRPCRSGMPNEAPGVLRALDTFSLKPIPEIPEIPRRQARLADGNVDRVFMQSFPKVSRFAHPPTRKPANMFHKSRNSLHSPGGLPRRVTAIEI
jgi:hypothetical protein